MDYNAWSGSDDQYIPNENGSSSAGNAALAQAALFLSIFCVLTCVMFFISIPLGSLAIILALLSKGTGKLPGKAKVSVFLGTLGLILTIALTTAAVTVLVKDPGFQQGVHEMIDYYYSEGQNGPAHTPDGTDSFSVIDPSQGGTSL